MTPQARSELIGFKRHLRAAAVPGEGVYLTSARSTLTLLGEPIHRLAPLLDGSRSLDQVRTEATRFMSEEQFTHILTELRRANLIDVRAQVDGPVGPRTADAYWDLAGAPAPVTAPRVSLRVVGDVGPERIAAMASALEAAGLELVAESGQGPSAGLTLVLCEDYLDPRLQDLGERFLAERRTWVIARVWGPDLWVGPFLTGPPDACWRCVSDRLRGHRRSQLHLRSLGDRAPSAPPEASLPATRSAGLALAALEIAKWFAGLPAVTGGASIWTLDTLTLTAERHRVQRRPQCPDCGDPTLMAAGLDRPVVLTPQPRQPGTGTGCRSLSAEQMWQRYRHLASPLTGITTRIQRDPRTPDFIHSYVSGPNLAIRGAGQAVLAAGLRQQSGGKGRTELDARVGALCEAVERYSGSRCGDEVFIRATLRDLGDLAVHPDRCQLVDPRQFAGRRSWNAEVTGFNRLPEPFDETEPVDWTPVWSLSAGAQRLVPTDLLFFSDRAHPSLHATSNGCAAGSSLEDAVLQGLLELIERDAVGLWWYNRTEAPGIDIASFADPWMDEVVSNYRGLGREVWLLDLTSDFGVPVVAALSRRTDKSAEDIMFGFGAHPDPAVAASRALAEMGQLMPAVASVSTQGDGYGDVDADLLRWWQTATVADQPYLMPSANLTPRCAGDFGHRPNQDIAADVRDLVERLGRADLDVLVLDQTRPDIGMPVVRVLVPGLRTFWARFAPGRLFDVPVQLGRLTTATDYAQLNPIPLFV